MSVLGRSIEAYLREVVAEVLALVSQGKGRGVLGAVPGRTPAEDVEIEVDRVCQELLERWCRKTGSGMEIYSEHGVSRPSGINLDLQYLVSSDPFDGSGLFRRGLAAEWWSVLSIYDINTLEPVCGGAVDILRKEIYLADADGVTLLSLDTGSRDPLAPWPKTAIDGRTVIAAYLMDPSYLTDWMGKASGLLSALLSRFPEARLWPNGGSCIYPWLARGLVHAYVMFNEPRSEIDPGLAFAWAGRCPVFSVGEDGALQPYQFIPRRHSERVPFFISACTRELAEEIVKEILPGEPGGY
jgi:hypothetical protein